MDQLRNVPYRIHFYLLHKLVKGYRCVLTCMLDRNTNYFNGPSDFYTF